MFSYNLTKYHVILLTTHLKQLNSKIYKKKSQNKKLNWVPYFSTAQLRNHEHEVASKIKKAKE